MHEVVKGWPICFGSKPPKPFHKQKSHSCHRDAVVKFMIPVRPGKLSILQKKTDFINIYVNTSEKKKPQHWSSVLISQIKDGILKSSGRMIKACAEQ